MSPLDIAVLFDSPDENWPSMDLVGEMLLEQWRTVPSSELTAQPISIRFPRLVRRLPGADGEKVARNADRAFGRYIGYPLRAAFARRKGRLFHVVDHSYAQLVHALPAARTGVYCHDLDVLQPALNPKTHPRGPFFRALAWTLLRGIRSAAIVFHNSREVGRALLDHRLVRPSRLVYAPLGVASEFNPKLDPLDGAEQVLAQLRGRPFVLHVGSEIPRKRLDVVFDLFAELRSRHPEIALVQQGARLTAAQRAHVERLGLQDSMVQPPKLSRATLAGIYRRASVVLVTSEAEGFGIPVIEAMACGAVVIASDIPVLREVGGDAVLYAPVGDVPAWSHQADAVLRGVANPQPTETRIERASGYTWARHARTILDAYRELHAGRRESGPG